MWKQMCKYCQCPKLRGGQKCWMQPQLGASPFLPRLWRENSEAALQVLQLIQRRSWMAQAERQGRTRHFPGPALHPPFLMQVLLLLPAAGLVPCWGGRCCLEASTLNSAAGNGKIWRVLSIRYSVHKFILLFLFLFPQHLILKWVWENTRQTSGFLLHSVFSLQCENFSKSSFCRNTAYSTN